MRELVGLANALLMSQIDTMNLARKPCGRSIAVGLSFCFTTWLVAASRREAAGESSPIDGGSGAPTTTVRAPSVGPNPLAVNPMHVADLRLFGAKGDGASLAGVSIKAGQDHFTKCGLTKADQSKYIEIPGAGASGAKLVTTISSVSGCVVTVGASATNPVERGTALYGSLDTAAVRAAFATAFRVYIPPGNYLIDDNVPLHNDANSRCHGAYGDGELSLLTLVGTATVDLVSDKAYGPAHGAVFENFSLTTTNPNATSLFRLDSPYWVSMREVRMEGQGLANYDLWLEGGINGPNLAFHKYDNCRFNRARSTGAGVELEDRAGAATIQFDNCDFTGSGFGFNSPIVPKLLSGVSIASASNTLSGYKPDDGVNLTADAIGKQIQIVGAGVGGGLLTTTIEAIAGTTVTIHTKASTAVIQTTARVGAYANQNQGIVFNGGVFQAWTKNGFAGDLMRGTAFIGTHFEGIAATNPVSLGERSAYGINGSSSGCQFLGVFFNARDASYAVHMGGVSGSQGTNFIGCYFTGTVGRGTAAVYTALHQETNILGSRLLSGWAPKLIDGTKGASNIWQDEQQVHYHNPTATFGDYLAAPLLSVENETAAASGKQEPSPAVTQTGHGWKTNAPASSQEVRMGTQVKPVQGAVSPAGQYHFLAWIDAAKTATDLGNIDTFGFWSPSGGIVLPGATPAQRGLIRSPSNSVNPHIIEGRSTDGADFEILGTDDHDNVQLSGVNPRDRLFITSAGIWTIVARDQVQGQLTEPFDGQTSLLLRRNVGGSLSLQRVTMGASDSCGAGFKCLRVPN